MKVPLRRYCLATSVYGICPRAESRTEFLTQLTSRKVKEFETTTFECEISKKNVKATWFKGQREVRDLERVTTSVDGLRHTLTVTEAELGDADKYRVVFEEGVESTADLTVEGALIYHLYIILYFTFYLYFYNYIY